MYLMTAGYGISDDEYPDPAALQLGGQSSWP